MTVAIETQTVLTALPHRSLIGPHMGQHELQSLEVGLILQDKLLW